MADRKFSRTTFPLLAVMLVVLGLFAPGAATAVPPVCGEEGYRCYENGVLVGEWYTCPGYNYYWWGRCEEVSSSNWVAFDPCAEHYCDEALAACVQEPSPAPAKKPVVSP